MQNKRLKALAVTAGVDPSDEAVQKFAALIVEECAAIAKKPRRPMRIDYQLGERIADAIKVALRVF